MTIAVEEASRRAVLSRLCKPKRPPAAACREALVVRWCGVGLDGRDDRGVRQVDAVDLEATGDLVLPNRSPCPRFMYMNEPSGQGTGGLRRRWR